MTNFASLAAAQSRPTLIRDTEIEAYLHEWADPIFQAAGLPADSVDIILVQNNQKNAFVAGGANIFFFTGLLTETDGPEEIIGVLAHEAGHIRGGHLVRRKFAMERASFETILGTLIGIGAAIATGEGGAAAAISAGSQANAINRLLAHSRVEEASADQAALTYFERAKMDPVGLLTFMEKLQSDEFLPLSQQTEWVRTHPLTSNRISSLRAGRERSPHIGKNLPAHWYEQHARLVAKLRGYLTPQQIPWQYDDRDESLIANYARAIAAYRDYREGEALRLIDILLEQEPENPYFLELKGQMLVDFNRVQDGIAPYKRAVEILPDAPLIHTALAHALIEVGGETNLNEAISHLRKALPLDDRNSRIYRLLGTAWGRLGDDARAKSWLAEEALLTRRIEDAKRLNIIALEKLPEGSAEKLRMQDLKAYLDSADKDE